MKTKKILCWLILSFGFLSTGFAQKITGTIVDKVEKQPIIGASVRLVGNNNVGAASNVDGHFTLNLPNGTGELKISYLGYVTQSIKVNVAQKSDLYIELEPDNKILDEVVVVGYGTQKKENLTGAVSSIDPKLVQGSSAQNLDKGLQGRLPGLNISYRNGDLSTGPALQVRGLGSLNGSGGTPLILVDNVETTDLRTVNPEDIESISLLKDAASTSIYGTRAAFGVLLIKTKSGKRNQKTTISYSNNFGWNQPTDLPDFPSDPVAELEANTLASYRNQNTNPELFGMSFPTLIAGIKNWQSKYANNRTSNEMVLGEDWEIINGTSYFYRIWDPKKEMFKDWSGQQTHNIQISGGSEKIAYIASLGFDQTNGLWKPAKDQMNRLTGTLGVNASVTDWFDLNIKYQSNFSDYHQPFYYQNYFYYMWRWGAYFPYGTYKGSSFRNVNGYMENASDWTKESNRQRINTSAIFKLTKELNINVDYAYTVGNGLDRNPGGPVFLWDFWTAPFNPDNGPTNLAGSSDYIAYTSSKASTETFNAYAIWEKKLRTSHSFKLTAGVNSESGKYFDQFSKRMTLLDKGMAELPLAIGDQTVDGSRSDWAVAGFFGRINYNYEDKWLLEVNGRYDGSSKFPSNSQWGFFPSASVGYRISSEKFMEFSKPFISDLKLRGSFGSVGNQDVGNNRFVPLMPTADINWAEGGKKITSVSNPATIPVSLTWERVSTTDIGLDTRFFKNRFNLTVDWFQRNTQDMIAPGKTLPSTYGATSPVTNAGDLQTTGWEIALGYDQKLSNGLRFYTTLTFTDNTTKITKWNNPSKLLTGNYEGKVIGEIWGFETDRYFTKEDDMTKMPDQSKLAGTSNFKYGVGDVKYKDLDDSKIIDGGKGTLDDHGDLKVIGNMAPRFQYGILAGMEWKGFDFEFYLQGVGKRELWGRGDLVIPYYRGADLLLDHQMDFWSETNTNAEYPRVFPGNMAGKVAGLTATDGGNNFYPQTKYLLDMSYLRVKNITLGYTLPMGLAKRICLQKFRIYVSAQNIFEFTNLKVPIDPETDYGSGTYSSTDYLGRSYPYSRTVSFGAQLTF